MAKKTAKKTEFNFDNYVKEKLKNPEIKKVYEWRPHWYYNR